MYVCMHVQREWFMTNIISLGKGVRIKQTKRLNPTTGDTQIRQNKLLKIQRALSSLDQWACECVQLQTIFCHDIRGRGGTTEKCILIGPFQKTF